MKSEIRALQAPELIAEDGRSVAPSPIEPGGNPEGLVLYHGTSTYRLNNIQRENCLRRSVTGDEKVSLTPEHDVAEYFAHNAVFGDQHDHPNEDSEPVVLVLDGEGLVELLYDLEHYSDTFWGGGGCDWEREIACWDDVEPLDEVLTDIEQVSTPRRKHVSKAA